ncbi:Glutathione peroxidase [Paragonimus heterotremus]|uniref:Glutathione peroxidase n=1 Tax=Paragonimus heterotremus TaxID=100268 RepID=A0A8J4TLY5_9TREM|nr:Glutathione peroxidase [Paragonimus heterotremus]
MMRGPDLLLALALCLTPAMILSCTHTASKQRTIYDFVAKDIDGNLVNLSRYHGKVCIIVNLFNRYVADGFCVLAFPSNQFFNQEPGTNKQIKQHVTSMYNVTFDLFAKIDVNGRNAHPLYEFLKSEKYGFFLTSRIETNYVKFLIDRSGKPYGRYSILTSPMMMLNDIQYLLNQ